jgi:hypothetical protein
MMDSLKFVLMWLASKMPVVLWSSRGGADFATHAELVRMRSLKSVENVVTRMNATDLPGPQEAYVCGLLRAAHSIVLASEEHLPDERVLRIKMIAEAEARRLFGQSVSVADANALAERTMLIDMLSALMECRDKDGNLHVSSAQKPALSHLHYVIDRLPKSLYREAYTQRHSREPVH